MMRLINTKAHALYDYLLTGLLVFSPGIFDYAYNSSGYVLALIVAVVIFITAFFSRFEYGFVKVLPMRIHFLFDYISGTVLAISPWLFSFSDSVYKPHLVFGLSTVVVALLTDRLPYSIILQLMGRGKGKAAEKKKQKMGNFQFIYERGSDFLIRNVKKVFRIPFR